MTRDKKIIRAYKRGDPIPKILKTYNISRSTMYNVLRRHGVPADRPLGPIVPEGRNEAILAASESGMTAVEVGAEFGLSAQTVYGVRRRAGITGKKPVEYKRPGLWARLLAVFK